MPQTHTQVDAHKVNALALEFMRSVHIEEPKGFVGSRIIMGPYTLIVGVGDYALERKHARLGNHERTRTRPPCARGLITGMAITPAVVADLAVELATIELELNQNS